MDELDQLDYLLGKKRRPAEAVMPQEESAVEIVGAPINQTPKYIVKQPDQSPSEMARENYNLISSSRMQQLDDMKNRADAAAEVAGNDRKKLMESADVLSTFKSKAYSNPELDKELEIARKDYGDTKPPEESPWAYAISALGPAILGAMSGSAGAKAAMPATQSSMSLYEKSRKTLEDRYKSNKDSLEKRVESLLKMRERGENTSREEEKLRLDAERTRASLLQNISATSGKEKEEATKRYEDFTGQTLNKIQDATGKVADLQQKGIDSEFQKSEKEESRDFTLKRDQIQNKAAMDRTKVMAQVKQQERAMNEVKEIPKALAGAQGINNALTNVESKLGFSLDSASIGKKGELLVDGKAVDLPGVSVPGIGRVSGYSGEARQLQSAIAKVFNVELRDRSGAAVTSPELERLKEEFATGQFNTEAELIQAAKDYKSAAIKAFQNAEAGFRPESLETYRSRGGQTSKDIKNSKPEAKFPMTVRKGGKMATVSNEKDLKEAQAEGWN